MLLNAVNFNSIKSLSLSKNQAQRPSFLGQVKSDSFHKLARPSKFEFNSKLSLDVKKTLAQSVIDIANSDEVSPLGFGATGVVYHIPNVDGLEPNGAVIKFSYTEDKNPITGESQKVGFSYDDEIKTLKKLEVLGDNSQQYLGSMKLSDGRNVLITTYVNGITPDAALAPLNKDALKSALTTLSNLDSIGVLHRDLKKENLLIDENDNIKLIDYGEAVDFDILNPQHQEDNNFPPFELPTNFQSFEDTFISPYVDDLQKLDTKEAREFFRSYLTLKSQHVFSKKADELSSYLEQNANDLENPQIKRLNQLIDYQTIMEKALSEDNLSDEIVDIELMKNQVLYMSELAYKNEILLRNPLANVALKTNALICAKKLEAMVLKQINRPNKPEIRKYLDYQLQGARYRQEKIGGWLNGLVGWITTCLTDDINTQDENKKRMIDDCVNGENLEKFTIPNIANGDK